ncbi:MAG TPA: hypothetical protein VMC41_03875, partial [Candidatus Nanoarchaeia archaeon]|nr:hypothetical protein [Candidatus Nanoarchaeia archaeon]
RQTKKLSQKENLEELSAQKDKEGDEINFEGRWNEDVDYPYNSEILKQLAKTGSHESIDFCLNLLEKSSDMASIYKTELENILQNIDADYSTEKLIEIFKSGEKDEIKNRSAKMLFRLELSKVGTAENDLAFLDKWFDNLEPAAVKNIFSRYVDILSLSANAKEEIKNHFKKDANFSETETEKISANLLRKADDLLAGFGKGGKISAEEVLKELDKYQADSVFLLELFKTIKENETTDIKFEDIKGINLEKKSGTEVLQNDFPALAEIYRKNYDADPALADQLIERFEKILQDKNGSAYILKKGEKIIAFSASQTIGEGKKFAAAMNIDPEWRGSGIGALFVQETMKKESENSDIAADFNADLPVSSFYLGPKVRFAANKFIPNYKESGKKFFEAEIKNGQKYSYQNLSAEELKKSAVEAAPAADKFILKIPRKNYPAVMEEMINKKGYKLTRYINEASDDYIYGAFEKI